MTANPEPHENLIPLLANQLSLAGTLDRLLQAEYQALLMSDLASLAGIVAEKRQAAESLERSSQELHQRTGGAPHRLIREQGPEAERCWLAIGALADQLRSQNLSNGALLNERQNRLRWVAQRAGNEAPPVYARGAAALAAGFASSLSGRSLARA